MALTFHPPKFGYNYPSNDVLVPTPAVGMITATPGDSVYALGFHVDNNSTTDLTIPSAHQFSLQIPADGGQPPSNGNHTLTFVAFNSMFDLFTDTYAFTVSGGTPYLLSTPHTAMPVPSAGPDAKQPPGHTVRFHDKRIRSNQDGRVVRDLKVDLNPPIGGQPPPTPHVLVHGYFESNNQSGLQHLGSVRFTSRNARLEFPLIHPNAVGQITLRFYLWDPDNAQKGDKVTELLTKLTLEFDHP
jgi:hypothetical protein